MSGEPMAGRLWAPLQIRPVRCPMEKLRKLEGPLLREVDDLPDLGKGIYVPN